MRLARTALILALVGGVSLSTARADPQASQTWFHTLPFEERFLIQFSLMFTDDYVALTDGVLGRHMYEALLRFQTRNGLAPTGVLSSDQVDTLLQQAASVYGGVGFDFVYDPPTGLKIGVPLALLTNSSPSDRGTRWSSADRSVEMETVRIPSVDRSYSDIYARMRTETGSRGITYEAFSDGFFVLAGTIDAKKFYSRFVRGPEDTRGFSLAWEPQHDRLFSRLSIAISNTMTVEDEPAAPDLPMGGPFLPADAAPPTPDQKPAATSPGSTLTRDRGRRFSIDGGAVVEVSRREIGDGEEFTFISVEGDLKPGDDKSFKQAVLTIEDRAVVSLKSNGGDLRAGIEIGKTIWTNQFMTVVEGGVCASACALAWLAGRPRFASPQARIGFHAPTRIDDPNRSPDWVGSALVGGYLAELGFTQNAIAYMTEKQPDDMHWLTDTEARRFGIYVEEWR